MTIGWEDDWLKIDDLSLEPRLPQKAVIDISSSCQLKCPLCPTGTGKIQLKKSILSLEKFEFYLSELYKVNTVSLFNWGEPFLNPQIADIIRYANISGLQTVIDSNLSIYMRDEFIEDILSSGLTYLNISLDGASQDTYERYRINGNFNLVFNNIARFRNIQKRMGYVTKICWKFLVNRWNEHEVDVAKKLAKAIDVDIRFDYFHLSEDLVDIKVVDTPKDALKEYWLPKDTEYKAKLGQIDSVCPWLFSSVVIHPTGEVLPCCYCASTRSSMGSLDSKTFESFEDIWYSDEYKYARSLFIHGAQQSKKSVVCEGCNNFKRI